MSDVKRIRGVCPHDCPDTCGFVTEVVDGVAVDFKAEADHPITDGWLCNKVRPYLDRVDHPDRLLHPLRRTGAKGSGEWARISWDEALDEIAERWRDIIGRYGAEAILPYSYSGTLGLVQMLVSSERFWNRLGASRLERSICGEAAAFAVRQTLGARRSPPYEHVLDSRLVVIWGHNPVSTAPHFMPFLRRAQREGCRLVVIDPRRTRTAKGADWHLQPLPGTDGALALGLAHVMVRDGLHEEAWLAENTVGWPALRERVAAYPPQRVAEITGLPAADVERLARLYATTQPALIKIADGLQRHRNGGQTVRAILSLPALTGQYGVRGGGLAYSTSGYVKWDGRAVAHWQDSPPLGRIVNMNRLGAALLGEAQNPPVQSLFVFGANPVAVSPRAGRIVEGMRREDLFTVVHELFMTDTADYADIVLPATTQLEHVDLHKAYGHTVLSYNAPALAPQGEARSNWDVMRALAARMGFDDPWLRQSADEVIDEVLTATADRYPALAGITLERLKAESHIPLRFQPEVPFGDRRFPTPSGKVELRIERWDKQGLAPLPEHVSLDDDGDVGEERPAGWTPERALNLITGASHHFVTSSLANMPGSAGLAGEPFVELHPDDAAGRGIEDGSRVIVENGRGWVELRAVVTDRVRPGVLASPKGYWAKNHGGRNVNWTTSDALGDMAGQSTFHTNRVWIRNA